MRYPKYLQYLDLLGAVSVASATTYVLLPISARPEDHLDGLWGNLSSEMIGIWLSVRLIDWIIRSHESSTKARVRVVRSLRYVERLLHTVVEFRRSFELRTVYKELDWIESRMPSRRRYLKPDEVSEIDLFYAKVQEFLLLFPPLDQLTHSQNIDHLTMSSSEEKCQTLLAEIENARRNAERNVLEETDEDEGI
jgi:hypothetical protein